MLRKKKLSTEDYYQELSLPLFYIKNAKFFQKVFFKNLFQSNIEPFYDNIEKVKRINMLGQNSFIILWFNANISQYILGLSNHNSPVKASGT